MGRSALFGLLGLLVAAGIAFSLVFLNRGSHLDLQGSLLNVRTVSAVETESLMIVDYRAANTASYPFVVRDVTVLVTMPDGSVLQGETAAESDVARTFPYFPQLGAKQHVSLLPRERIAPQATVERMIMARFTVPEAQLKTRRSVAVRIVDLDGAVSDLSDSTH